jgi:hypothetical protein
VLPRHAGIYDSSEVRRLRETRLLVDSKDIEEKLGEAATVLRATYNPDRLEASSPAGHYCRFPTGGFYSQDACV